MALEDEYLLQQALLKAGLSYQDAVRVAPVLLAIPAADREVSRDTIPHVYDNNWWEQYEHFGW